MARNVVDELVVRLTADATRLQAELGKAERDATSSGKKVGASFGEAFRNAARLGAIAVTSLTAVGTAFFVAANKAAAYADQIDKTAIRTRLSRGALQELAFAADQAGVEFTAIEANIRAFTGRLAEAERGSVTVTGTFDRLGVALRDQNGALRDTESLFLDTIEALSGIDNESTRAALAVQAFGEQGSALLPFLNLGAEGLDDLRAKARELGLVLDDEAIGSLVEYKDEVSALGQEFAAVRREAVTKLIPVLRDDVIPLVRDDLLPAFVSLVDFLAEDVAPVVGNIATGFTDLSTAFETFVSAWESGEGRLEGTLGILERIQRVLGFDVSGLTQEGLDTVFGFVGNTGSGGRDAGVPVGPFLGPDFANLPAPFGPQNRPAGFVPASGATTPPPASGGAPAGTDNDPVAVTITNPYGPFGGTQRDPLTGRGPLGRGIATAANGDAAFVQSILDADRDLNAFQTTLENLARAGREVTRDISDPGATVAVGAARGIVPNVSAVADFSRTVTRYGQELESIFAGSRILQAVETRRGIEQRAEASAAEATSALNAFTESLDALARRGRAQAQANATAAAIAADPFAGVPGVNPGRQFQMDTRNGGAAVPIGYDVGAVEDATNAQIRAVREQEAAALQTKQAIITAGVQFGSDLASAIKSGSPSGIFGALTGGIGGLVGITNPFAGGLINLIGGLFGGFLPDGRDESEAARAAGARPNGAPAVELNLQVFQNLAVQSLTGESRAAVDGLLDQTVSRIESVLVSFGQRLTAVEARTA